MIRIKVKPKKKLTSTDEMLDIVEQQKNAGWCVVLFTPPNCVHKYKGQPERKERFEKV